MPSGIQIENGLTNEAMMNAMEELDDTVLVEMKLKEWKINIKKSWQDIFVKVFLGQKDEPIPHMMF